MARNHSVRDPSTVSLQQRRALLLAHLSAPPDLIRASVVEQHGVCGKRSCRCRRGEKHGPYYYLTQCVEKGRVRKFLLKTPQAVTRAQKAVTGFKQFYDTLEELSQINAELLRRECSEARTGPPKRHP